MQLTIQSSRCLAFSAGCQHRPRAVAVSAAKESPWARGSGSGSSSGGSGSKGSSSKGSSQQRAKGKGSSKPSKNKSSSSDGGKKAPRPASSGQGFGPSKPSPVTVFKVTLPLTPQLLDELSPWEVCPAPLWSTFTGHCEGEWLGQYSAYTPWGGEPEPVWADESGAYLTHAFCRVSEVRQSIPAADDDNEDGHDDIIGFPDNVTAAAAAGGGSSEQLLQQQQQEGAADAAGQDEQQQQQQKQQGELLDLLVRTTSRSASISSLIGGISAAAAAAAAADSASPAPAAAAEDEDVQALAYNVGGSVVFNGGSFSAGPEFIAVPEADEEESAAYYAAMSAAAAADGGLYEGLDEDAEGGPEDSPLSVLPFSTVVIEQALVAGGDRRLRMMLTLKLRRPPNQEMDIEVARLVLYKEFWYGTSDSSSSSSSPLRLLPAHQFAVPVTELPRPQPADFAGTWNVFVVAANPAVEENPNTLQDETVLLYSSREERQHWHVPAITSSAATVGAAGIAGRGDSSNGNGNSGSAVPEQLQEDDSGGSFWLPGGAVVTLRMVDNSSSAEGQEDGDVDSNVVAQHRGLMVGLHMLDGSGSCLFVEREYDADGQLLEVRQGTAVKGGWSGGRM